MKLAHILIVSCSAIFVLGSCQSPRAACSKDPSRPEPCIAFETEKRVAGIHEDSCLINGVVVVTGNCFFLDSVIVTVRDLGPGTKSVLTKVYPWTGINMMVGRGLNEVTIGDYPTRRSALKFERMLKGGHVITLVIEIPIFCI